MSFFDLFPTPKFLEMTAVGLSISDSAVRFVELNKVGGNFVLGKYGERSLPPGVVTSGFIYNSQQLANILSDLKKDYGLNFVKATLPEEKAYLFKTEIPKLSQTETRSAISFKLEENVPISTVNAVFDYSVIEDEFSRTKDHQDILVSVLPVKVVRAYFDAITSAGLTPLSFEIESQAIADSVINKKDRRAFLIINLTKEKTGLYVVSDGVVQFTSTLNPDETSTPRPSIKVFDISQQKTSSSAEKSQIFRLANNFTERRDEVRRIYDYWNDHKGKDGERNKKIQKVILCGESDEKETFAEHLRLALKTEVDIAQVWSNCFPFEDYIPPMPLTESLPYAAAIGLALPDFYKKHA